jgi:hypothetical protein
MWNVYINWALTYIIGKHYTMNRNHTANQMLAWHLSIHIYSRQDTRILPHISYIYGEVKIRCKINTTYNVTWDV